MSKIVITGYTNECNCDHCGRALNHGIILGDGRTVGAQCLNSKMTKPRIKPCGKTYRYGREYIIKVAKCVQFLSSDKWLQYGVCEKSTQFESE